MEDWIKHLIDEDYLKDNMTFASLYIAVYENMVDYVESNIKAFLCNFCCIDGKEKYIETSSYKKEIKNRTVDDKGNKDITKASFLWFVDRNAITKEDYNTFLAAKETRNKFAHELFNIIISGISEQDVDIFFRMISLYKKISKWWFVNIEAEIAADELPEGADIENVLGVPNIAFDTIINVLYNGKSKEYKKIIESYRGEINDEV